MKDYIKKELKDIKINKISQHKVFRKEQVQKQAHNKNFNYFQKEFIKINNLKLFRFQKHLITHNDLS